MLQSDEEATRATVGLPDDGPQTSGAAPSQPAPSAPIQTPQTGRATPAPPQHGVKGGGDVQANEHARHEEHGPPVVPGPVPIIALQGLEEGDAVTQARLYRGSRGRRAGSRQAALVHGEGAAGAPACILQPAWSTWSGDRVGRGTLGPSCLQGMAATTSQQTGRPATKDAVICKVHGIVSKEGRHLGNRLLRSGAHASTHLRSSSAACFWCCRFSVNTWRAFSTASLSSGVPAFSSQHQTWRPQCLFTLRSSGLDRPRPSKSVEGRNFHMLRPTLAVRADWVNLNRQRSVGGTQCCGLHVM